MPETAYRAAGTITFIASDSALGRQLAATRERNLARLRPAHPDAAAVLDGIAGDGRSRLFADPDYRYGLADPARPNATTSYLTDFDSIPSRQQAFTGASVQTGCVVLLGIGIGELPLIYADALRHAAAAGSRLPTLWLVEPEPERLDAMLGFIDLHDLWPAPGLELIVGPDWSRRLAELLTRSPPVRPPLLVIGPVYGERPEADAALAQLVAASGPGVKLLRGTAAAATTADSLTRELAPIDRQRDEDGAWARRYRANRDALAASGGLFDDDPEPLSRLDRAQPSVARDRDGGLWLLSAGHGAFPLSQGERAFARLIGSIERGNSLLETYAVVGADDGALLSRLVELTVYRGHWQGFGQVIYLIEPEIERLRLLLERLDLSTPLRERRLRIFTGADAARRFGRYLAEEPQARGPSRTVVLPHYLRSVLEATVTREIEAWSRSLDADAARRFERASRSYDALPLAHWRERYASGRRLRVLVVTSRMTSFLQYCARDVAEGFRANGHEVEVLIERDGLSWITPSDGLALIERFRPELVFLIDHLRDEEGFRWIPQRLPLVCWIQDMLPNLRDDCGYRLSAWDHNYVFARPWIDALRANPTFAESEIGLLPVPADTKRYRPLDDVDTRYDVGFVTHLIDPRTTFWGFRDPSIGVSLEVPEQQLLNTGVITREQLESRYRTLADALDDHSLDAITRFITTAGPGRERVRRFVRARWQAQGLTELPALADYLAGPRSRLVHDVIVQLKWRPVNALLAAGIEVAVWGHNWELLPNTARVAHGVAANGEALNRIQNQTRINLNNSGGISFHMRAGEIIASGSFMLTRDVVGDNLPLTDYFERDREVVLFGDEADLVARVRHFLGHPDARRAIAARALARLRADYTYAQLARKIVDDIGERLARMETT